MSHPEFIEGTQQSESSWCRLKVLKPTVKPGGFL
jgi:hypothetical protein